MGKDWKRKIARGMKIRYTNERTTLPISNFNPYLKKSTSVRDDHGRKDEGNDKEMSWRIGLLQQNKIKMANSDRKSVV